MQSNLFDPPIAHTNDPATSHEAAERHTASGKRAVHGEIVLALVRRHPDRTACELWALAQDWERVQLIEMQECRRRLTDLLRRGEVRQGEARACMVRGTRMVTWQAT